MLAFGMKNLLPIDEAEVSRKNGCRNYWFFLGFGETNGICDDFHHAFTMIPASCIAGIAAPQCGKIEILMSAVATNPSAPSSFSISFALGVSFLANIGRAKKMNIVNY